MDTTAINVNIGDWVMATEESDYKFLIGVVTEINEFNTPEHETDNYEDDIHVDFTTYDYSPQRIREIEEYFSELYDEVLCFDDIPLDDVIMAPSMIAHIADYPITT